MTKSFGRAAHSVCSLPACGGGLGRGVAAGPVRVITPLPVPPPQGGRERRGQTATQSFRSASMRLRLMRILVTNDDGIHSDGLDVCAEIARALSDDVWIVAPEFDQSGVSHSLSLNDPLRLRPIAERRFAVKGTPTDCVIMGAKHILKERPPDLVLSGVNRGRNAGEDVIYSGTVAGAVEGTILGIPSFALSQSYKSRSAQPPYWETAIAVRARHHPPRAQRRHPARRADQRQFPELHARRGRGHRGRRAGPPSAERLHIDAAPRRPRPRLLLDRLCARTSPPPPGRHRYFRARRQPHHGHAACAST